MYNYGLIANFGIDYYQYIIFELIRCFLSKFVSDSSFGRFFGFGQQPKLDNLLKQQNLTIETILNEDDILQELKGQSASKLGDLQVQYLCSIIQHPEEYKKMIGYIVDEIPEQCQDRNRCIRFPFLISEILGSENEKLISYLFEKPEEPTPDEEIKNPLDDQETEQIHQSMDQSQEYIRANLLNQLMQILDNDAIIVTTAGYFSKVVGAIINKRGLSFWEHLKHDPDIISNMIKHSYLKHIVNIFEKLISLEVNFELQDGYEIERKTLLIRLLSYLKGKRHSQVIVENLCELFIDLYKKATSTIESEHHIFRDMLLSLTIQENPSFFMGLAINTQQSVVYSVLNAQFEFLSKITNYQIDFNRLYKPIILQSVRALEQVDCLKVSFKSSDQTEITPLGEGKLNLIQLLVQLSKKEELYEYFNQNLFKIILDLVKLYPSNNQLHLLFEKLVISIVDSNNEYMQTQLFEEANLLLFLIQRNDEQARQNKFGFQGILTRLSNYIDSNKSKSKSIELSIEILLMIDTDWDRYMQGLVPVNKREQEWILGVNPKQKDFKYQDESPSPPLQMPEPLVQYAYNPGSMGIRKCESSDNNDVVQPKDDQEEPVEIEEEIEDEETNKQYQQEEQINSDNQQSDNQLQQQVEKEQQQVEEESHQVNEEQQQVNEDQRQVKEEYIETQEYFDTQEQQQQVDQGHQETQEIVQTIVEEQQITTGEEIQKDENQPPVEQAVVNANEQQISEPEPEDVQQIVEEVIQTEEIQGDAQEKVENPDAQIQDDKEQNVEEQQ